MLRRRWAAVAVAALVASVIAGGQAILEVGAASPAATARTRPTVLPAFARVVGQSLGEPRDNAHVAPPSVTSITPGASAPGGGARLIVRGRNFRSVLAVRVGDRTGSALRVLSAQEIEATAPAHAAGLVDVRVSTAYGTSAAVTADHFTYEARPDPIRVLTVLDSTRTTVTMQWRASDSADAARVVIRRAPGKLAPSSPSSGALVAALPASTTAWTDSGLTADQSYAYTVFATTRLGPIYSVGASVVGTTPTRSRPDMPTDFSITPTPVGGAPGCSDQPYGMVAAARSGPTLSADIADPDGTAAHGDFRLWDTTTSAGTGTPTVIIGADDPAGQSGSVDGSGPVSITVDPSLLTADNVYETDVVADDGTTQSASSYPCYFVYAPTAPQATTVRAHKDTYRVGTSATFTFTASNIDPAAPGIDHFGIAFDDPEDLDGDHGTHVTATDRGPTGSASLTFAPSAFGEHFLYVQAVDAAGHVGQVTAYPFYVADN